MSDPQSVDEFDHVLANIRQLVSAKPSEDTVPRERLVLTPDLRVLHPNAGPSGDLPKAESLAQARTAQDQALPRAVPDLAALLDANAVQGPDAHASSAQPDDVTGADSRASVGHGPLLLTLPLKPRQTAAIRDQAFAPTKTQADPPVNAEAPVTEAQAPEQGGGLHFVHSAPTPSRGSDPLEFADDDASMDEEMLRDIIAEIVREELAGDLGERITRNVRKLVRREIMRALAARDFD